MGIWFTAAVAGATMLAAAPVLAGAGNLTQPATAEIAIWAYPSSQNYCPAGLQSVIIDGVICCGRPTHTGYSDHPARSYRTTASTPYIAYGKGYEDDGTGN